MTSLSPEILLAEHDFVRSLARSLLRDAGAADDVVQRTWLVASTKSPRDAGSVRAWLARPASEL